MAYLATRGWLVLFIEFVYPSVYTASLPVDLDRLTDVQFLKLKDHRSLQVAVGVGCLAHGYWKNGLYLGQNMSYFNTL